MSDTPSPNILGHFMAHEAKGDVPIGIKSRFEFFPLVRNVKLKLHFLLGNILSLVGRVPRAQNSHVSQQSHQVKVEEKTSNLALKAVLTVDE